MTQSKKISGAVGRIGKKVFSPGLGTMQTPRMRKKMGLESFEGVTRDELIEALLQELDGPIAQTKKSYKAYGRLVKHNFSTVKSKIKHKVAVAKGTAKPGSHWSRSSK